MLDKVEEILEKSLTPQGCCNAITPKFISLFHEAKQMGIVLRKSFKGDHFWIPPIPKQIKDAKKSLTDQQIR